MAEDPSAGKRRVVQIRTLSEVRYDFDKLSQEPDHIVFRGVVFQNDVTIPEDHFFPLGISFVNVTFRRRVIFGKVNSEGPIYFWNCRFEGETSFFRLRVSCGGPAVDQRLPGEGNFSYCRFLLRPSFDRAQFLGQTFFHRTIFFRGVDLEEVRFEGGVTFEGSRSDICFSEREVNRRLSVSRQEDASEEEDEDWRRAKDLISRLKDDRILFRNTDHLDHINFDWKLRSEQSLIRALKIAGSQPEQKPYLDDETTRIIALWKDGFGSTMFGGYANEAAPISSFRGTQFGPRSSFNHVKLGNCLFLGANISESEFLVVEWARQPCGLLIRHFVKNFAVHSSWMRTWRAALQDEFELDRDSSKVEDKTELRDRRKELSELYRALRMAYDRENDSEMGRDFYFGEIEAERLSLGPVRRRMRLSYLYRAFSGYSKREGLALGWLLSFIFLFFPFLIWLWVGRTEASTLTSALESRDQMFTVDSQHATSGETRQDLPKQFRCVLPQAKNIGLSASSGIRSTMFSADEADQLSMDDTYTDTLRRALDTIHGNGSFWSGLLRLETNSLQASSFLSPQNQVSAVTSAVQTLQGVRCSSGFAFDKDMEDKAGILEGREFRRRLLEGLERLIVPAQLGLFLLALRAKFQRSH